MYFNVFWGVNLAIRGYVFPWGELNYWRGVTLASQGSFLRKLSSILACDELSYWRDVTLASQGSFRKLT